jgi:hypothetical protein
VACHKTQDVLNNEAVEIVNRLDELGVSNNIFTGHVEGPVGRVTEEILRRYPHSHHSSLFPLIRPT